MPDAHAHHWSMFNSALCYFINFGCLPMFLVYVISFDKFTTNHMILCKFHHDQLLHQLRGTSFLLLLWPLSKCLTQRLAPAQVLTLETQWAPTNIQPVIQVALVYWLTCGLHTWYSYCRRHICCRTTEIVSPWGNHRQEDYLRSSGKEGLPHEVTDNCFILDFWEADMISAARQL